MTRPLEELRAENTRLTREVERLRLAVADEREACAKLCEEKITHPPGHQGHWEGYGPVRTARSGEECAAAIRARGRPAACTFAGGNEPCSACPRSVSALHMCGLLQDELAQSKHEVDDD